MHQIILTRKDYNYGIPEKLITGASSSQGFSQDYIDLTV